ncbi:MAG: hypothetical protein KAQ83_01670 [Nanoarchaeota archaeon]|nr:hypothetical protein [Nanoarchaeota archaeon]
MKITQLKSRLKKFTNSKKAMDYQFEWPEMIGFGLLVIGLLLSLSLGSKFLTYIVSFLFGLFFGRIWYQRRKDRKIPYVIIISGFVIGYMFGSYYGNRFVTLIMFLLGGAISYYIHRKGWILPK